MNGNLSYSIFSIIWTGVLSSASTLFAITDAVAISIVTSAAAVIMAGVSAYFAFRAKAVAVETHTAVNSRMDEFKKMSEEFFTAKGVLKEKGDEKVRKAEALVVKDAVELKTKQDASLIQEATDKSLKSIDANTAKIEKNTAATDTAVKAIDKKT